MRSVPNSSVGMNNRLGKDISRGLARRYAAQATRNKREKLTCSKTATDCRMGPTQARELLHNAGRGLSLTRSCGSIAKHGIPRHVPSRQAVFAVTSEHHTWTTHVSGALKRLFEAGYPVQKCPMTFDSLFYISAAIAIWFSTFCLF